ncbi:MAG TPA: hypothetical protein VEH29_13695 [Acidimicrobiales bacterium]|nr:hypothetical protein [Acidimicrobiales bacterium]
MTVTPVPSGPTNGLAAGTSRSPGSEGAASSSALAGSVGFVVIDSCHSTWLFDVPALRFRRILKGLDVDPSLAATDWRPYVHLELAEDSDAFVVVLNEAGTRRIRSWRHVDGCDQCDGEKTTELSVEDIRRLAHA